MSMTTLKDEETVIDMYHAENIDLHEFDIENHSMNPSPELLSDTASTCTAPNLPENTNSELLVQSSSTCLPQPVDNQFQVPQKNIYTVKSKLGKALEIVLGKTSEV